MYYNSCGTPGVRMYYNSCGTPGVRMYYNSCGTSGVCTIIVVVHLVYVL